MQKHLLCFGLLCYLFFSFTKTSFAQTGDCPYPIIFIHGYISNETAYEGVYNDADFINIWGERADVFYTMQNTSPSSNIWGNDGIPNNSDDDVLTWFTNETNELNPGCVYAVDLENAWNEDVNNPIIDKNGDDAISFFDSESNEAAIYKAGVMLKNCISAVLAANPDKKKVIIVGHSMGGLHTREYLQRLDSGGTPLWWVDPSSPDGHKVARVLTNVTPHLGSNTFGNVNSIKDEKEEVSRDGFPDINSSAARDLRYNWSCGFLGLSTCTAAYLYGGEEGASYGYWHEDVNCDGDEDDFDIIGINIDGETQGVGDEWDGTYANPAIPLPTNIRYTWFTSDILGFDGDGVVAWERQWLYENDIATPNDGVNWRLTDTLLTNRIHTSAQSSPHDIIRGIDEPDYPIFAYEIEMEHLYADVLTYRSTRVPEGTPTMDVDFFKFDIPADFNPNQGLEVHITAHNTRAIQLAYYSSAPADYLGFSDMGEVNASYASNTGAQIMTIPSDMVTPGETAYLKIQADVVSRGDWKNAIPFIITTADVLSIELSSFWGDKNEESVDLQWKTSNETKADRFLVQRSSNGLHFETIGEVVATGNSNTVQHYQFLDKKPLKASNYYRLKSLDLDGSFEMSKSLHFDFGSDQTVVTQVYPVPAQDFVMIDLEMVEAQEVTWVMTNVMGRQVNQGAKSLGEGEQQMAFSLEGLTGGIYFIALKAGDFREQIRILKK